MIPWINSPPGPCKFLHFSPPSRGTFVQGEFIIAIIANHDPLPVRHRKVLLVTRIAYRLYTSFTLKLKEKGQFMYQVMSGRR